MAEEIYAIPEEPVYSERIRKLQDSDPASASLIFNPLFEHLIENTAAVKRMLENHDADMTAHQLRRHVIATRTRDPARPTYGLDGGGGGDEPEVQLEVESYTGEAEVSAIVSGVEYDANNMSASGEGALNGTLILTKLEE